MPKFFIVIGNDTALSDETLNEVCTKWQRTSQDCLIAVESSLAAPELGEKLFPDSSSWSDEDDRTYIVCELRPGAVGGFHDLDLWDFLK